MGLLARPQVHKAWCIVQLRALERQPGNRVLGEVLPPGHGVLAKVLCLVSGESN